MGITDYPGRCSRHIRLLMDRLCPDAGTAYKMMLMTAALMDIHPEDKEVVEMILSDCHLEVEA